MKVPRIEREPRKTRKINQLDHLKRDIHTRLGVILTA